MQAMLRIVGALVVVAGCGTGLYFWFERYQEPTVRTQVAEPLYTVDSSDVAQSLAEGRPVREYGPLPGSAFYPGMPAFQQPEEALVWLKSTGKYEKGWRVFESSGDFTLDTHLVRGLSYTNKTLKLVREVPLVP